MQESYASIKKEVKKFNDTVWIFNKRLLIPSSCEICSSSSHYCNLTTTRMGNAFGSYNLQHYKQNPTSNEFFLTLVYQ
jgi:hypothetical protein